MLPVIAALALGAVVWAARSAPAETGARDWRGDIERRNARHARNERQTGRAERKRLAAQKPRRARVSADCCAASDDHWKSARDVYDRWRAPDPMSYREALNLCWHESIDASARGDYSKPATRRCALGKQHANKLTQWKHCREGCRRAGLGDDPLLEAVASEAEFLRWLSDEGDGGTVWARSGSPDLARVSPGRDGWRVEFQAGGRGAWRLVDELGDEAAADDYARDLLDLPF